MNSLVLFEPPYFNRLLEENSAAALEGVVENDRTRIAQQEQLM